MVKMTVIGCTWVTMTSGVEELPPEPAFTRLPGSTSRRPAWPLKGATMWQ
jgi:hypothetical protein